MKQEHALLVNLIELVICITFWMVYWWSQLKWWLCKSQRIAFPWKGFYQTGQQDNLVGFFLLKMDKLWLETKRFREGGWFNELQTANIVQPIVSFWKSAFPFFSVLYQDTGNLSFCMKTFGLYNGWTMLANLSLNWSEVSSFNQFSVRVWFENSYSAKSEGRYCLS